MDHKKITKEALHSSHNLMHKWGFYKVQTEGIKKITGTRNVKIMTTMQVVLYQTSKCNIQERNKVPIKKKTKQHVKKNPVNNKQLHNDIYDRADPLC